MRKIIVVATALLLTINVLAQGQVEAHIENLRSDKGVCRVCMFNSALSFKGEGGQAYACLTVPVIHRLARAMFSNVPPGNYAIMVFHDENNNNKLDQNFLGMPKEGYGSSKNKLPFAGAPGFKENMFTVTDKLTTLIDIRLRNL